MDIPPAIGLGDGSSSNFGEQLDNVRTSWPASFFFFFFLFFFGEPSDKVPASFFFLFFSFLL
jgi:hypothetical protein